MNDKKAVEVSKKLDNIKLWKLPEYMLGRALCVDNIIYDNGGITWRNCVYMILQSYCEISYMKIDHGSGNRIYFLFSSHNSGRKEHAETFEKIAGTCRNRIELVFDRINFRKIKIKNILRTFLMPVWLFQIKVLSISGKHKLFLLANLLCALAERDVIEELVSEECSMMVCYFDGAAAESLVVQDFNLMGRKTATMQHGHFHPNGFAFYASTSQYFLASSNYECRLAKQAKVLADYVIALGMGKYIGEEKKNFIKDEQKRNSVGVVFDGDDYYDNNVEMLKVVKQFAVRREMYIKVKYHPTSQIKLYEDYIDSNYMYNVNFDVSVEKFMDEVDFVIVANSTILLEAIFMMKPWYRYRNPQNDIFEGIDNNVFSTVEELEQEYQKEMSLSEMLEYKNYILGNKDAESEYRKFFEKDILNLEGIEESSFNEEILL